MKYWCMFFGVQLVWGAMAVICNMPIGHTIFGALGCALITIAYDEYHKEK